MLWILIRIAEAILMSTHNICFYAELTKIILQLSSNNHFICSTEEPNVHGKSFFFEQFFSSFTNVILKLIIGLQCQESWLRMVMNLLECRDGRRPMKASWCSLILVLFLSNNRNTWNIIWAAAWQNQQNECAHSEDSDQPGHPPSLIRVFPVRSKGS